MGRLTHKNSKRNATFVQSWDYQYDAMNNIKSRVDNISLQGENFSYDNLNRLLDVYQGPLNQQFIGLVQSMNYDNLGNMTHKTDVGDMQYSTTHPFQMEMLTENPQTITSEHVLEYFVSGRTKTIEDNDKKLQFTYGSDLQRRKMEYFLEDQLQSTTLYPFGNYEEVHNAATNDVLKYNYIGSPDGLIAIRKTTNGTSQLYYTLTDHLGSIDALCDENGSVVERYSYDAWGNRRNPSDWTLADIRTSFITNRGFTSHEQLTNFGLINMNVPIKREQSQACLSYAERKAHRGEASTYGRIYDPMTLGFLSPDPFVQNPSNSQNFNRFSYVLNNPLKYVDPSGYNYQYYIDGIRQPSSMAKHYMMSNWDDIDLNFHSTRGGFNGLSNAISHKTKKFNIQEHTSVSTMFLCNSRLAFNYENGTMFLNNSVSKNGISKLWASTGMSDNGKTYSSYFIGDVDEMIFSGSQLWGIKNVVNTTYMSNFDQTAMDVWREMGYGNVFEGVNVYSLDFGSFRNGAAVTLPKIGIIVGSKDIRNIDLLRHEFGHILQERNWGLSNFIFRVAPRSLYSTINPNIKTMSQYMSVWTEWSANKLSFEYFNKPKNWDNTYLLQPVNINNFSYPPKFININP